MTQAALRGRRAGLTITLGLCTGLIVHTTAVALGVAVIFQQSELAFSLLKYAGAAYLAWLAWLAFRAKPTAADSRAGSVREGTRLYLRGILMNITNPKVSIFFLAFLPQFVDKHAGHVTLQMFALGGLFIVATLFAFSLMALFAASAGARFGQSAAAQKVMNKIAGVVFLGLALKLATTQR
ncbi:TPA: LysE family translocator [Kluyvera intermedia]|nr:threonine transporter RhtB [Kluyvera intermedia]HAT2205439.1 LysE family translocator [Kluyvera intermedia]HAT2516165.1 LysE family translocator [Kluyvera intermedia]HAT2603848.1 LysE family translocator [Kluyvera intermedia]HAT2680745.1 LysE family translocator [Kluyvera intermedia]